MTNIPNACYLSLDVEDYTHATMLDMGLRPRTNPEQTWRGLRRILSVLRQAGGHPNMTLFTTGQIARDQPDLIREMSRLGHEIACHGDQHENVCTLSRTEFAGNVRRAKDALEDACGQRVIGFRAPNFSLDERSTWAYAVLSEAGFLYDSSLVMEAPRVSRQPYDVFELSGARLYEFPLYRYPVVGTRGIRVIGGTYFRCLPLSAIIALMRQALRLGYTPLVYLHAAHADDQPSPVTWKDMQGLSYLSRSRWTIRQKQWMLGTHAVADKLLALLKLFPHLGPMSTTLPMKDNSRLNASD